MSIEREEWQSIYEAIARETPVREIVEGAVIDRDEETQTIFVREIGPTPIPLVGMDYKVHTYKNGKRSTVIVEPMLPEIGDIALVARLGGNRGVPRCVGIIRNGRPWKQPNQTEIQRPKFHRVASTSDLTLTTTSQDIPGCSMVLDAGHYLVIGAFDFDSTGAGFQTAVGRLVVAGVVAPAQALMSEDANRASVGQTWVVDVDSNTTIKLQGNVSVASGICVARVNHTTLAAVKS